MGNWRVAWWNSSTAVLLIADPPTFYQITCFYLQFQFNFIINSLITSKSPPVCRSDVNNSCHTDAYTLDGHDPEGVFPVILGVSLSSTPTRRLALFHSNKKKNTH